MMMNAVHKQPFFLLGISLGLLLCMCLLTLSPGLPSSANIRQPRDVKDSTIKSEPSPENLNIASKRHPRDIKTISVDSSDASSSQHHRHDLHHGSDHFQTGHDVKIVNLIGGQEHKNLDIELSNRKESSNNIFYSVLGTHGAESETVVKMTWASGGVPHHVSQQVSDDATSYADTMHALRSLCSEPLSHEWYVLVKDTVYVNQERVSEVLQRMSPDDNIVLGVPTPEHAHYCSLDAGLVLSHVSLRYSCTILDSCHNHQGDMEDAHVLGHCLEKGTGVRCSDILKVSDSLHLPGPDISALQPHIAQLSSTLFIGPVDTLPDLYRLHLVYTERRISLVQQYMFHLSEQLAKDSKSKHQRPKRNSQQADFERTVLQSHGSLLNSSDGLYNEYFDSRGSIYSDSCVVTENSVASNIGLLQSQSLVNRFLSPKLGKKLDKINYFGYRTVKPMTGAEYQFYYVHEDQVNKHGYYYDKLYQVIVKQSYEQLQVSQKHTKPTEDITIVTIADDLSLLEAFLVSLVDNCHKLFKSNTQCSILLLYDTILFNDDSDLTKFNAILQSVDRKQVLLRTLDIGASSHIMNNFQRAVVSVHETLIEDSLIVFLHPKSHITEQFLYRCQVNAVAGSSAYFPIPFQLTKDSPAVAPDTGFWKNTDYDTFCVHTKDLQKLSILPKSPQMLHQFLTSLGRLQVRRLADTGVWRLWDDGICPHLDEDSQLKCRQDFMYRNL